MAFNITGMTLSIECADTNYGAGTKSFCNLSARCPEGDPIPIDDPNQAITAGLDMYFTIWTTLMNGRLATRIISKEEFEKGMKEVKERIQTLKARLYQP